MKVLFVTGLTHHGTAGVQRAMHRLADGLVMRGLHVGLVLDAPIPSLDDVQYFFVPYPPPDDFDTRLRHIIQRFDPDLVHVSGGGVRLMWAIDRAVRDRPWVVSIHNIPPRERTGPWFHGRNGLHYALRNLLGAPSGHAWRRFLRRGRFTRAICHSDAVMETARRTGCPAHKLVQIPLGCDEPADALDAHDAHQQMSAADAHGLFDADDSPRLISVGGMAHPKGFHDYLRVVARLVKDHPNLRYALMGDMRDNRYYHALRRQIDRLGLTRHCHLAGHVSDAQRIATARAADLYVVPSHEEGFCLSFLEGAMLAPRALGTRCGAIPELASGDPALRVVPPRDLAALEETTRRLLRQPVTAEALARRHRALLERYNWQHHVEAQLQVYHELVGAPEPVGVGVGV